MFFWKYAGNSASTLKRRFFRKVVAILELPVVADYGRSGAFEEIVIRRK
jgi:hypothetical protein